MTATKIEKTEAKAPARITKVEMAKKIVTDNPNATRKEIVEKFMSELGMSKAGATTYAYNLAKGAPKAERKAKAPKAPKAPKVKAEKPAKAVKAEKAEKLIAPTKTDANKEARLEMMRKVLAKMKAE